MSLDEAVLRRLLQRGERARLRDSARAVRESFRSPDSVYWRQTLDNRERFHVRMRAAATAGAISLEWSPHGGDDRPLDAVRLVSVDRLAKFLQTATLAEEVANAHMVLNPWVQRYPRVIDVLNAWAAMKQVRSLGPTSASDFKDALRVLDFVAQGKSEDLIVRAVSVALFRNSKRIEELDRHLDVLTTESLSTQPRHRSEVYALLGLVKEPQPFLLAGAGMLMLQGERSCPIVFPYIGIANNVVLGYQGKPEWVMTIENLATFHQAAKLLGGRERGLIIYTGGMPSPSWCKAYRLLLLSLPADVPVYHWGDVDEGGFRIAAHIRQECTPRDRTFLPWLMESDKDESLPTMPDSAYKAMVHAARRAGWVELAETLRPIRVEQEGLLIRLP